MSPLIKSGDARYYYGIIAFCEQKIRSDKALQRFFGSFVGSFIIEEHVEVEDGLRIQFLSIAGRYIKSVLMVRVY
jgi:hypothetical protein